MQPGHPNPRLPHPVLWAAVLLTALAQGPLWGKTEPAKAVKDHGTATQGAPGTGGQGLKPISAPAVDRSGAASQLPGDDMAQPEGAGAGQGSSRAEVASLIERTAKQLNVEVALVHAVVAAESAYNPRAVSHAGAVGLMQIMPATAADYGVTSPEALFDPSINIKTGVRHLKRLLEKYDNDYGRAIMAYNAGEGVVDRTNSNVTYAETLDYTDAVVRHYRRNGGTQSTDEVVRKVATLRRLSYGGKARRLLKRYLDPSLLSLKVRPTLSLDYLDPMNHHTGPASKPMFELHPVAN